MVWGGAAGMATMIGIVVICLLAACSDRSVTRHPGPVVGAPGALSAPAGTCADADLSELKSVVYVKAGGADGNSCGLTTGNACKTIQQGINNCAGAGCGVLVRHSLYPTTATITLRDSVSLYGSCLFDGEADHKYRTTIQASPAPGTPAISASGINTPTTVSGLVVIGKDETANGTASIAMTVSDSKGLTLSHSVLAAGKGGDGAAGQDAAVSGSGGSGGGPGTVYGGPGCSGVGNGGYGSTNNVSVDWSSCLFDCNCSRASNNSDASPGADSGDLKGGPAGANIGGAGCMCHGRSNDTSGDGDGGQNGAAGACSGSSAPASPAIFGALVQAAWQPVQAPGGSTGAVGAGGGGGQAGGYAATINSSTAIHGEPGGGGGGGGCGGNPGAGGQQGGASIGLLLDDSTDPRDPVTTTIVVGQGGVGGRGGSGGAGGTGGSGASGGGGHYYGVCIDNVQQPGSGGKGGDGGQGGAGGGGAGGNGGPSIGIALTDNSPMPGSSDGIYLGKPGTGGPAGSGGADPNCTGARGADGVGGGSGPFVNLDKPAPSVLSAGQALTQVQSRVSAGGIYELVLQTDGNFCLYKSGGYQWCSLQAGLGTADKVTMQTDGNLCLSTNGATTKCTNTAGHPGAYLMVRDDGHAVIYDGSAQLWSIP